MRRLGMMLLLAACTVALLGVPIGFTQDGDEDIRGSFLTTRPSKTDKSAAPGTKAVRRRPKTTSSSTGKTSSTTANTSSTSAETKPTKPKTETVIHKVKNPKIGIGLTLFMRDSNGLSVRVDPNREFRQGERVRLLLETNADGYLYIFNTTDGGQPIMIYPDKDLDEGGNYIQAHVPVEIPSSTATEERLRWFRFDAQAGVERLYFVFSREPLSGIPLEDELLAYCAQNRCPLSPVADLWAKIQADAPPVRGNKTESFGAAQTMNERQATTRGIGLSKEDPEPSLVMMTASSTSDTLITTLDLVHK